jgi:hypothetical protein
MEHAGNGATSTLEYDELVPVNCFLEMQKTSWDTISSLQLIHGPLYVYHSVAFEFGIV